MATTQDIEFRDDRTKTSLLPIMRKYQCLERVYIRCETEWIIPEGSQYRDTDAEYEAMYTEAVKILTDLGWEYNKNRCHEFRKGDASLGISKFYLTGIIDTLDVHTLARKIQETAKTFHIYRIEFKDLMPILKDDEHELQFYKDVYGCESAMLQRVQRLTTTKRSNLYKSKFQTIERLIDELQIHTNLHLYGLSSSDPVWKFATSIIEQYIAEGILKTGTGKDNIDLVRFATKKERPGLYVTKSA